MIKSIIVSIAFWVVFDAALFDGYYRIVVWTSAGHLASEMSTLQWTTFFLR